MPTETDVPNAPPEVDPNAPPPETGGSDAPPEGDAPPDAPEGDAPPEGGDAPDPAAIEADAPVVMPKTRAELAALLDMAASRAADVAAERIAKTIAPPQQHRAPQAPTEFTPTRATYNEWKTSRERLAAIEARIKEARESGEDMHPLDAAELMSSKAEAKAAFTAALGKIQAEQGEFKKAQSNSYARGVIGSYREFTDRLGAEVMKANPAIDAKEAARIIRADGLDEMSPADIAAMLAPQFKPKAAAKKGGAKVVSVERAGANGFTADGGTDGSARSAARPGIAAMRAQLAAEDGAAAVARLDDAAVAKIFAAGR